MSDTAAAAAAHGISRTQWRTLIAAQLGWMLDGIGQLRPRDEVRFEPVSLAEARWLLLEQARRCDE